MTMPEPDQQYHHHAGVEIPVNLAEAYLREPGGEPKWVEMGTVIFGGPPQALIVEGHPIEPLEQQYMARFDGDEQTKDVLKSWLEPV